MARLRWSLPLLFAVSPLAVAAPPAHAVDQGECATMSSTVIRGEDELYANTSCSDGVTGHHPEITGFELDPDEPAPPPGWSPSYTTDGTNFYMPTDDRIAGQGWYRVHIVWLNSDSTIAYDTAYITVKFTVMTANDLGVTDLAHTGSTARGGSGTYTFRVTNSGQTTSDVSYDLTLSPGTAVPTPPAGCAVLQMAPLPTVAHCVVGTLVGGVPFDAAVTVVNSSTGSSAVAAVSVFGPWSAEPEEEDGGHPNEAYLGFNLTDPATNPGTNPGGGTTPVAVAPKVVKAGKTKVKGAMLKFAVKVRFPIPAGQSGAVACLGKMTGSTKPKGLAKASTSKKALSVAGATCSAKLTFKLPRTFAGTKVKLKVGFPGNAAVSPFAKTSKVKLG